jgi:hypothetical protein
MRGKFFRGRTRPRGEFVSSVTLASTYGAPHNDNGFIAPLASDGCGRPVWRHVSEGPVTHRGVAPDDARNVGVLAFLEPLDTSDEDIVCGRLTRTLRQALRAKIDATVAKVMSIRSPPLPVSQPPEAVADPLHGLGTHPDLISRLCELDDLLPEKYRCACRPPGPPT